MNIYLGNGIFEPVAGSDHEIMKAYELLEVFTHPFLISAPDGGDSFASKCRYFFAWKELLPVVA